MDDEDLEKFAKMAKAKNMQNDAALEAELDALMNDDPEFKKNKKKNNKKNKNDDSSKIIIYI
jgi:hypothetical protein